MAVKFTDKAISKLFSTWMTPLTRWGMYKEFSTLINSLNKEYHDETIYPSKGKVFKIFREVPYDKLKVIILFQDPYHDGKATGIALANEPIEESEHLSPSLRIFMKEWDEDPGTGPIFNISLLPWCKQGVMFLNSALTVKKAEPLSHQHIWRPWTQRFLTSLSMEKTDLVYVLLGRKAQRWKDHIINGSIIIAPHPAAEIYQEPYGKKAGFYGSRIFSKINEQLKLKNKEEITW